MAGNKPWPEARAGHRNHAQASVVIIGAGISGMCMAIDLLKRTKCRDFIILEKSSSVGGTWYDNKYPGCCCDVFSALYSYSFEQKPDWSREYPGQEEILDYLTHVAEKYNLYKHIRFGTFVEEARWDDETLQWRTKVVANSGSKEAESQPSYEITSDFLVSAVGQLNVPKWPDSISGLHDFKGKLMHSARWDWSYDLEGKRIALVGNGATAVQILPEIQKVASKVTIFQRTPNWIVPRYDRPVHPIVQGMLRYIPPLRMKKRSLLMDFRESTYGGLVDVTSWMNKQSKEFCLGSIRKAFPDDVEMQKRLTPNYSPGCKRILISDDYYPALSQPNVHLETRDIVSITASGIKVGSGDDTEQSEYDLIVCATGFQTLDFLHPIKLYGRNGTSLTDIWSSAGGAQALYAILAPSLPNFGMLYGPNSNLGHNSIILMIEAQSRYIAALTSKVLDERAKGCKLAILPKEARMKQFNEEIQMRLSKTSFADNSCKSWYKTESGLITNNWCGTVVEYQKLLSEVKWGQDFDVLREEDSRRDSGIGEAVEKEVFEQSETTYIGRVREEGTISNYIIAGLGVLGVVAGTAATVMAVTGRIKGRRGLRG